MRRHRAAVDELVPLSERYRWIVACRAVVTVLLAVVLALSGVPAGTTGRLVAAAAAWLVLTGALTPVAHRWRRPAVAVLAAGLFGDGVLLGLAWWESGGLDSRVGVLIVLHSAAVTLLASFRTGIKLALWHSVVAVVLMETAAEGLLTPSGPVPVKDLVLHLATLWVVTVLIATFAAVNERELRRRRYDSERLRHLGLALTTVHSPAAVLDQLARFGRDELMAARSTVLTWADGTIAGDGQGVVADAGGARTVAVVGGGAADAVVARLAHGGRALALRRLDPVANPGIVSLLGEVQPMVVVPFALDQLSGVLILEHPRWSVERLLKRVERRLIATAEQAATQASLALGRAVLTERMRVASEIDALTGVANRGAFNRALDTAVTAAHGGVPFALVMIDLDHFKRLNDTHGHQAGDDVLRTAASVLASLAGEHDLAARYGGEEFAMILRVDDVHDALDHAELIRAALESAATAVAVTASIGVAFCPADARDAHGVLAAADAALYEAKRGGRNQVRYAGATADQS
jgi:two-component system cell cycle response regulator